jgi:hypothetical protein
VKLWDLNLWVHAFRKDSPEHERVHACFIESLERREQFIFRPSVASSFLRLVTNPRIFKQPSTPKGRCRTFRCGILTIEIIVCTIIVCKERFMKNITLSAEESLIARARERARERHHSLNDEFRSWLSAFVAEPQAQTDYEALMERLSLIDAGRAFSRDEANER